MSKRGQITTTMIVGFVILILFSFVLFMTTDIFKRSAEAEIEEVSQFPIVKQSVRPFVESCIQSEAENAVFLAGFQGGYIWLPEGEPVLNTPVSTVPYWFYNSRSNIPSKNIVEDQISMYLDKFVPLCLRSLDIPGYDISIAAASSNTIIKEDSVLINSNIPIELKKEDTTLRIERFLYELPVSLGKVLDVSDKVIDLFEADPSSVDLTSLNDLPLFASVYNFNPLDKIVTIRDPDSVIKGDPFYQFSFGIKMVEPFNRPPIFASPSLVEAKVGEEKSLKVNAKDPDGQELRFSSISHLFEIEEDTGVITFIAEEPGNFAPVVEVIDPYGESDYTTILILVTE